MNTIEAMAKAQKDKLYATTAINNKQFRIKKLPALKGLQISTRLAKIILPLAGGTFDGLKADTTFQTPRNFTHLALTLCDQIDNINLEDLSLQLLNDLYVDGNPVDFDEYFSANYGEFVEVLAFALQENFSSFFTQSGITRLFKDKILKLMSGLDQEVTE